MDLNELKKYEEYDVVPIKDEMYSDFTTPLNVLRNIKEDYDKFYLLESVEQNRSGRYSYLGYDPIHTISCKDYVANLDGKKFKSENPFDEVKKLLSLYKAPKMKNMPPL